MSRERGGSSVTSRPSMLIAPPVTSSSPASIRSRVDFPQPEGPTSTRNSPLSISRETSSTATTSPLKTLVTCSSTISATAVDLYRASASSAMALTNVRQLGYSRPSDCDGPPAEGDEAERDASAGVGPDRPARHRNGDPVRAAAERRSRRLPPDRPSRPGRPRPRGLRRAQAGQRYVRPTAEDRPGADHDVVQRGHAAPRDDPGEQDPLDGYRARRSPPRAAAPRLPVRENPGDQAFAARRRRDDGDRGAASSERARPRPRGEGSRGLVLRAPPRPVRRRHRERHPGDRADGDERGGVGRARRAPALACIPLRADEPRRRGPDGRIRPVGLPRRPLPDRDRAQPASELNRSLT